MISLACERMEPPFFMILVLDTTQFPKVDKCTNQLKKKENEKKNTHNVENWNFFLKKNRNY
jgi:hypothetical protein